MMLNLEGHSISSGRFRFANTRGRRCNEPKVVSRLALSSHSQRPGRELGSLGADFGAAVQRAPHDPK
jgi:hypothetical protein